MIKSQDALFEVENIAQQLMWQNSLLNAFSLSFKHPSGQLNVDEIEDALCALHEGFKRIANELSESVQKVYPIK